MIYKRKYLTGKGKYIAKPLYQPLKKLVWSLKDQSVKINYSKRLKDTQNKNVKSEQKINVGVEWWKYSAFRMLSNLSDNQLKTNWRDG